MATYGVLSTGFLAKPLAVIDSEIDSDLQSILGASAGTEPDGTIPLASKAGQLKSMMVDREAAIWDVMENIYTSRDPNQATDASLDALCALTGITRDSKAYSQVTVTCTGTPLTVLPVGRVVTVTDSGSRFLSLAASAADTHYPNATIVAATAWAALTAYAVGDKRTNSANMYYCITAGTSAGSGGPTTTSSDITDGTVHWEFLGIGTGYVDVDYQAESAGAIGASAGLLANIATPVDGWRAAFNVLDAATGTATESNNALRKRRQQALASSGNTAADAIRANILQVNEGSSDAAHQPPTACTVFFNNSDLTDANGLPPHSVEVLVQNGTDADIAQEVWNSVGAGTAMYGNQTTVITDSQGESQTVKWSRPTEVPVYVTATVYYDASQWAASSETVVAQWALSALLTYAADVPIGLDVRSSALTGAFMRGPAGVDDSGTFRIATEDDIAITGLLEVSPLYFGTTASPATSTTVSISLRQIATFDSSRCVITATTETP